LPDFLSQILETTRLDLDARREGVPLSRLEAAARERKRETGAFARAIATPGISLIAEIKRASPSKGDIRPDLDVAETVRTYERAGARAISVLTEERHFHGSLGDLRMARATTGLPLLRKDFIIDDYQIWEAAANGADAVLLIVAALDDEQLERLLAEAGRAGLDALVEVHDRAEAARATDAGAGLIGINNRNLATFKVNLDTTFDVLKSVAEEVLVVSESGIGKHEDIVRLEGAGVDAVLVGETLVRARDTEAKIRELFSGS
jgi:indole-3-glycerol phosphate synthase